jgi:hypothetical protein
MKGDLCRHRPERDELSSKLSSRFNYLVQHYLPENRFRSIGTRFESVERAPERW